MKISCLLGRDIMLSGIKVPTERKKILPTSSDSGAGTQSEGRRDSIIGGSPIIIGQVGPISHKRDPEYCMLSEWRAAPENAKQI
jgi:hypothetical protein